MSEKLYGILLQEAIPTPDKPQKIKNLVVNKEAKELIEKQSKEIERLNNIIKKYEKMSFVHEIDLQNKIDKTIEYIKDYLCSYDYTSAEFKDIANVFIDLLDTLQGVDKE